jgi:transposase
MIGPALGIPRRKPLLAVLDNLGASLIPPALQSRPNPIEMMFAKLKTLLRKADERSIAAVSHRIGQLLAEFSPTECANYFSHAGYASV